MTAADTSYMKKKPVLSLLLSMGIPMMLSMLINSLYNIVDGIFVARMSEDAMMAISLVYLSRIFCILSQLVSASVPMLSLPSFSGAAKATQRHLPHPREFS